MNIYLKALNRAVEGIHHKLRQRHELRGPIPSIAAVHQHRIPSLEISGDIRGALENQTDVLQPTRVLRRGDQSIQHSNKKKMRIHLAVAARGKESLRGVGRRGGREGLPYSRFACLL